MRDFKVDVEMNPATYGAYTPQDISRRCINVDSQMAAWGNTHHVNIEKNSEVFLKESHVFHLLNKHYPCKAFVVGAGPSLHEKAEQIAEAKRLGWIVICVDNAAKKLKKYGIEPDYVVCFDAQDVCEKFYCKFRTSKWLLRVSCSPKLVEKIPPDKRYWYSSATPFSTVWQSVYQKTPTLPTLREHVSVMHSAVDFAYKVGAEIVVTAGNECGWKIEWMDCCGGLDLRKVITNRNINEDITICANNRFVTKMSFKLCADGFESFVDWYGKDCRFYDMSNGLVKPKWQTISDLKEAI